jgi:hypothetical protein
VKRYRAVACCVLLWGVVVSVAYALEVANLRRVSEPNTVADALRAKLYLVNHRPVPEPYILYLTADLSVSYNCWKVAR